MKTVRFNERAQNEALQWKKEAKKLTVTLENVEAFIASKSSYVVSSKDIEGDYEALAIVESLDEAFDIIKNDSAGYSKYYCVEQNLTGNKVFYEVKDSKTNSQGVFDYYSEVRDLDDGYKLCLRDRTVNSVFTVD